MISEVGQVLAPVLAHPYAALFVALLFAGDSVLVPALTMAVARELSVTSVLLVSTLATMLSDAAWHALGRALPSRLLRRMLGRRAELLDRSVGVFEDHPARGLFWSKYLWGTKILAQVLSGRMRMAWRVYLPVNLGAVVSQNLVLAALVFLMTRLAMSASHARLAEVLGCVVLMAVVIGARKVSTRLMERSWPPR